MSLPVPAKEVLEGSQGDGSSDVNGHPMAAIIPDPSEQVEVIFPVVTFLL